MKMKKVLLMAIGLMAAGAIQAQTRSTSKNMDEVSFGIKAGGNLSNIIKTDGNDVKTDFKPGFHAGVFVEIPVSQKLTFAPEVMYSQKGYKADRFGGSLTQTTNWIDVPILAKIDLAPQFNIFLGPQVSFLTQTRNKFEGAFGTVEQTTIENESNKFRKSIAGGVIGAGVDITPKIGLSARYAYDFQKSNENGTLTSPEFRNQVIQASLGFKF